MLAFGSLVAAGLPLMLTILGLVASAGSLYLGTQLLDISIWAMNFALMFALALGIDYALFIVMRFRGALFGSQEPVEDAVAETMDTAGKAVLFSGVTVLISLTAVMLVPSPGVPLDGAGDHALGHLHPRGDADAAARGAGQARPAGRQARAAVGALRRAPLAAVRRLGRAAVEAPAAPTARVAVVVLVALALPVFGLKTGMPSIKVVPDGRQLARRLRPGPAGLRQGRARRDPDRHHPARRREASPRSPRPTPASPRSCRRCPAPTASALVQVIPNADPSAKAVGATVDRLRSALPAGALVGGSVAENHDLETALSAKTPLVIGVVLALGFLLLLVALQAPIIAALGVLTNLLATGAAFGVARLIFQDGPRQRPAGLRAPGLPGRLGARVLLRDDLRDLDGLHRVPALQSAKEHWDRSHDPKEAMIGGVAHSGRVVFAAAAVMVAVFFTFALSGPLPPKEMGVILGVAVLLDAALVRLLLVPVLLRLLGKWAWWLPKPLHRILPDVRFGHA